MLELMICWGFDLVVVVLWGPIEKIVIGIHAPPAFRTWSRLIEPEVGLFGPYYEVSLGSCNKCFCAQTHRSCSKLYLKLINNDAQTTQAANVNTYHGVSHLKSYCCESSFSYLCIHHPYLLQFYHYLFLSYHNHFFSPPCTGRVV